MVWIYMEAYIFMDDFMYISIIFFSPYVSVNLALHASYELKPILI